MSFKQVIKRSYSDVNTDCGIVTTEFLEASDDFIKMFDLFGSPAFTVVQNDIKNNVQKIRTRHDINPVEYDTLEHLMEKEADLSKRTATEAVLWLKRGLDFTAQSLMHSIDNPNDELKISFMSAYDITLRPYHSFIVRPIFNFAMNACPWRKDFYENIGVVDPESIKLMREYLLALVSIIHKLEDIFQKHPSYTQHS
ncbi:glycolipid transfer protein domain-containing protein [Pilobolus umbonatus]|nr:glycolipid transfer protein domain-containing protein [Pilobolus umbonatus]